VFEPSEFDFALHAESLTAFVGIEQIPEKIEELEQAWGESETLYNRPRLLKEEESRW
jgi:hypothetical protein